MRGRRQTLHCPNLYSAWSVKEGEIQQALQCRLDIAEARAQVAAIIPQVWNVVQQFM